MCVYIYIYIYICMYTYTDNIASTRCLTISFLSLSISFFGFVLFMLVF